MRRQSTRSKAIKMHAGLWMRIFSTSASANSRLVVPVSERPVLLRPFFATQGVGDPTSKQVHRMSAYEYRIIV